MSHRLLQHEEYDRQSKYVHLVTVYFDLWPRPSNLTRINQNEPWCQSSLSQRLFSSGHTDRWIHRTDCCTWTCTKTVGKSQRCSCRWRRPLLRCGAAVVTEWRALHVVSSWTGDNAAVRGRRVRVWFVDESDAQHWLRVARSDISITRTSDRQSRRRRRRRCRS